jgi:phage baseplate assembly protein W
MAKVNRQTTTFSDLDFNFTKLSSTKDVAKKSDIEAVKQSMRALINTRHFERPFQPYLGCAIAELLFENNTPMTRRMIEKTIYEVIQNHEPRAKLTAVDVFDNSDNNEYQVRIYFYVVNHTQEQVFETYLTRTR